MDRVVPPKVRSNVEAPFPGAEPAEEWQHPHHEDESGALTNVIGLTAVNDFSRPISESTVLFHAIP